MKNIQFFLLFIFYLTPINFDACTIENVTESIYQIFRVK